MQLKNLSLLKKQHGASGLLVLIFLGMAALILLVSFKLYPAYYENWQIDSVVQSFEDEGGIDELSEKQIIKRFSTRLTTNNVRGFNFQDSVFIEKDDGLLTIDVDYEVRTNVYRNIDAVVVFKKLTEIKY